jgi:hypothetical protein
MHLRALILPIYVSDGNTPARMRIGFASSVYAKALLVITCTVIAAFRLRSMGLLCSDSWSQVSTSATWNVGSHNCTDDDCPK